MKKLLILIAGALAAMAFAFPAGASASTITAGACEYFSGGQYWYCNANFDLYNDTYHSFVGRVFSVNATWGGQCGSCSYHVNVTRNGVTKQRWSGPLYGYDYNFGTFIF